MTATHHRNVSTPLQRSEPPVEPAAPVVPTSATENSGPSPTRSSDRRPSLRKNISWTLAGNVTYAACQWGILIAIARLGTPEMVGQFALALATTTPVFAFANLNLRFVQVTDAVDRFQPQDYVSLRLLTSACAFLVVLAVALIAFDAYVLGLVVAAMACVKASESLCDVIHGIQHKRERMKAISIARGIRGIVSVATVATLLAVTKSLPTALIGLAAVNAVVLLAVDVPAARVRGDGTGFQPFAMHLQIKTLLPLGLLSLPAGLSSALLAFNLNLPRYFIAHYLDVTALGYYAAAAYLLVLTDLIVRSARQTALPRLAKLYSQDRTADFCRLTGRLMLLGAGCTLPLLALAWIDGEMVLAWLYGAEYRDAAEVFFWLMIANFLWQSSIPIAALWAVRCYWLELQIHFLTTVVAASAGWVLVPRLGLVGAAWSMIAARIITSIGTASLIWFVLHLAHRRPLAANLYCNGEIQRQGASP